MRGRWIATLSLMAGMVVLPSSAVAQVPAQDSVTANVPATTGTFSATSK